MHNHKFHTVIIRLVKHVNLFQRNLSMNIFLLLLVTLNYSECTSDDRKFLDLLNLTNNSFIDDSAATIDLVNATNLNNKSIEYEANSFNQSKIDITTSRSPILTFLANNSTMSTITEKRLINSQLSLGVNTSTNVIISLLLTSRESTTVLTTSISTTIPTTTTTSTIRTTTATSTIRSTMTISTSTTSTTVATTTSSTTTSTTTTRSSSSSTASIDNLLSIKDSMDLDNTELEELAFDSHTSHIYKTNIIRSHISNQTNHTNSTFTLGAKFNFNTNLSVNFTNLLTNFLIYYLTLFIFILILVVFLFITTGAYFNLSTAYLKSLNEKSTLRKKKNISFDIIDYGYKLNRNTDHILNRIDSNYFPIQIDQKKQANTDSTSVLNENTYELPYTLETDISNVENQSKFKTFATSGEENNTNNKRDSFPMKSFNVDDDFKIRTNMDNSKRQSYLPSFQASNYNPYGGQDSDDDDEEDSRLEFLDEKYNDFIHKDEIYFRTKQSSNIFNPTLISQCLEYESATDLNLSGSKQIYGYSGE